MVRAPGLSSMVDPVTNADSTSEVMSYDDHLHLYERQVTDQAEILRLPLIYQSI